MEGMLVDRVRVLTLAETSVASLGNKVDGAGEEGSGMPEGDA